MAVALKIWVSAFLISIISINCSSSKKAAKNLEIATMDTLKREKSLTIGSQDSFMFNLLAAYPQFFDSIIKNKEEYRLQIIFTQIDRDEKGNPFFTDHTFNLNPENYFYPASTVKLPVALLALQKINELNISGVDKNTTIITGEVDNRQTAVYNDPTSNDGRPTIAHYIKKILLVSDNDAYNRLYEFLGQEYINNELNKRGYTQTQIIHRLEVSLTENENRHTNPVSFFDSTGNMIYKKESERSKLVYANRETKMGKGFIRNGELVNEPFDFSQKNRLLLKDLHNIIRSIIFPGSLPAGLRFSLTADDYAFLRKFMSMMPQESTYPAYDANENWDTYVKFLFYGSEKNTSQEGIRIFNKVGDAYGFLIDAAYIADFSNNIEFMVSATIHCNKDNVYNDNHYEYEETGLPFLKNLGRVLHDYELKRSNTAKGDKEKIVPDLSPFHFSYSN